MKINSELERVLLGEQASLQKKAVSSNNSALEAFGDCLESELVIANNAQTSSISSGNSAQLNVSSASFGLAVDGMSSKTRVKASTEEDDVEGNILESLLVGIQGTTEEMDLYADSLQDPADLKKAWESLSAMNQNITAMQKDYAKLSNQNSSVGAMLNSLDVMAVTETYKFNRGDYL